jgi:mannose-6-phosphate isomerase-like protein (cupin superfamily)
MRTNRIVTHIGAAGMSQIASNEIIEPKSNSALPGREYFQIWATEDGRSLTHTGGAEPDFWPGPNGTRCLLVRWAPKCACAAGSKEGPVTGGADATMPGVLSAFDEELTGMHVTDSIDYGYCVEGQLTLVTEDGMETLVTPGTCVVQRGTEHAWRNEGTEPATMLFVIVGADRAKI